VRPLVRAAAFCALLSAVAAFVPDPPPKEVSVPHVPEVTGLRPVCGQRAIPEGDACIPLPAANQPIGPAQAARTPLHARDDAQAVLLPRHPDRPAEYAAYVLPIPADDGVRVIAGGSGPRAPGERTGVDLAATKGDKVVLASLEGDEGGARVVFVGEDAGVTVATLHSTREGELARSFLVIYGHLDRPGPGIVPGARVKPGDVVGFAGDSGSPGMEQLYLEIRQIREGALQRLVPDDTAIPKGRLADDALSIATDARNVLTKRP
jgi:murein DD-endopeptidase MepM/ murein hydrolase activator NlpD